MENNSPRAAPTPSAGSMNISSVIVHAKPDAQSSVRGSLEQIPGVEIHAVTDDGKFVVTIETDTDGETASTFDRINVMDGVMSAAMVFHQFESDPQKEA
jgi:periplasmic nitrate reductase NapD